MCACEPTFTCSRCADAWHNDPLKPDPAFEALQDREAAISRPDFLKPFEEQRG